MSLLLSLLLIIGGCTATPTNPTFALTERQARLAWDAMCDTPRPFERPVIVLGGIHDPGLVAPNVARHLREVSSEETLVVPISFFTTGTFDACRRRVLTVMDDTLPADDPEETTEVDVVAVSMGGLVARHAARAVAGERRLRVKRLFTIATPHRGARLAELPTFDRRILDMRSGSAFLARLNGNMHPDDPELFPYTRLGDAIVGPERTAPPHQTPWWVPNPPLTFAHLTAAHDPRILADIARRLRGEPPFAVTPPAPLPGGRGTAATP
ncbi:MAG: hypothetical protein HKO59_18010 [Phycisphaerales bacterium]|nr:hypothetical protein [Phycisphaerae bacterium]NNM27834.1 hypothetical protein [Phycisphaerales bacterium]